MKYKVGDIVKIVACKYSHGFDIGEVVRITCVNSIDYRAEHLDGHDSWLIQDNEIEQKETTTMKYKEGDIVKIVDRKHGHRFDIGEIVKITEKGPDGGYYAEYLDGHDYWLVGDDEIEPANETTLITRPHDYTGCDPEIAEALKQGLEVYCEVWDDTYSKDENVRDWVTSYQKDDDWPYKNTEALFAYARPIRQEPVQETKPKPKLVPKPASEIFAWLENPENGYKQTKDGKFWEKENEPTFTEKMVKHCGKDSLAGYDWHPEWLREVPVEEPNKVSESSENNPQTAAVLTRGTAHLHPDDKVTIIRQHEDGDYLCEYHTGIRIWMQPYLLKFD